MYSCFGLIFNVILQFLVSQRYTGLQRIARISLKNTKVAERSPISWTSLSVKQAILSNFQRMAKRSLRKMTKLYNFLKHFFKMNPLKKTSVSNVHISQEAISSLRTFKGKIDKIIFNNLVSYMISGLTFVGLSLYFE